MIDEIVDARRKPVGIDLHGRKLRAQRLQAFAKGLAEMIEARGDKHTAEFVRTYADFLESHVEKWTVTNQGVLVAGIKRHYIRINPATSQVGAEGDEDPDRSAVYPAVRFGSRAVTRSLVGAPGVAKSSMNRAKRHRR